MHRVDRSRLSEALDSERVRFVADHPQSAELARTAAEHLLAGVPMAWMKRWPGSFPIAVDHAEGGRLTDVDGHQYADLCLGDTAAMGGHAIPAVVEAVAFRAAAGAATMLPTADGAWVGAELARRFGVPFWQFTVSATDANRNIIRLARHLTRRPKVLVHDWCYHGTVDETLVTDDHGQVVPRHGSLGPGADPGTTTVVVPFNDVDAVEQALAVGDVACVLAEPALTNIGIVLPDPGYHDALRSLTRKSGTLLVLDETHTICAGPGGYTRAQHLDPDAVVVGKAIGGGVPAGAYGLTAPLAERLRADFEDPSIDVSGIGGTLAGNALSLAAMRAALSTTLRDEDFAVTIPLADRFTAGVAGQIGAHDLDWHVQQLGCRAEYWFSRPPRDGAAAAAAADAELEAFMHLFALNRGVLLTPFHNMAVFTPHHTDADVDRHTEVFGAALDALLVPNRVRRPTHG